ncbi:prostaglandin reductase 1-like [Leptopilina heterotoma]|uniref:prostaglandin reductase 1-like n=1 Tax=Leptopilina heterotoma TaxID=63436 RepID=UPI001CA7D2ED|nr:prostaglandin reductase 1-like [Leptopilina heterotoma]
MVLARKIILIKNFQGQPQSTDFKIVEEELPILKNGEVLVEAEFFSVDPYMMSSAINESGIGEVFHANQVAKIIESKDPAFPVGQRVKGYYGWRTHTIINPSKWDHSGFLNEVPKVLPSLGDLPSSLYLGVLGMPGETAYFGFLEVCQPKKGEILVVSGAGGAIGSHVAQIGKIIGLKVIGITGTVEKCQWLKNDLKIDHVINYKTEDVSVALKKFAPDGVDCYFDNIGGPISDTVINHMKEFGRISICGSISSYSDDAQLQRPKNFYQMLFLIKQLKMEGFMVTRWKHRYGESFKQNFTWIQEKKLKYRETIYEGFENTVNALLGLMRRKNIGKAIVKL